MDYRKHYDKLIETRKDRILPDGTYYEKHHIVMRCMGGDNSEDNLIKLTAKEHLFAHLLLWKIYRTPETAFAFFSMCNGKRYRNERKSLRLYAEVRESYFKIPKSEEARAKIAAWHKGRPKTPEAVKKGIQTKKNRGVHPWNKGILGSIKHTEATKIKISDRLKNFVRTETHCKRISESIKKSNAEKAAKGISFRHSDDAKIKISKATVGRNNPRAKKLLFIDPSGKEYNINGGMKIFCKEHKLNYSIISDILNGHRKINPGKGRKVSEINNYKGWKVYELKE